MGFLCFGQPRTIVRKGCLVRMIQLLGFVTGLVALLAAAAQIFNIVYGRTDLLVTVVRVYVAAFCICAFLIELFADCKCMTAISKTAAAQHWPVRGILYTFIGVLTQMQDDGENKTVHAFTETCGYAFFALGVIYIALGVFCVHQIYLKKLEMIKLREEQLALEAEHPTSPINTGKPSDAVVESQEEQKAPATSDEVAVSV